MGAGIPTHIPAILDALATHQPVSQRIDVEGQAAGDDTRLHFDPEAVFPDLARRIGPLRRPRFLPIVASVALAQALLKRSEGAIDGYVVEGPTAGGHNAPPRGPLHLNERGEPIYGERDIVDPVRMAALGLPFWLGGGYGHPSKVREALDAGAAGVQVGTAFALCDESGLDAELKARLLRRALAGEAEVLTSAVASPTGFPFKVARLEGTLSEAEVYAARPRTCDLGYLRTVVRREDGRLAYRCPAEPVADYVRKGGAAEDTVGRLCLCNALLASAGFPQVRGDGSVEPPVITMGDDLATVGEFVTLGRTGYSAAEVIARLVGAEGDLSS
jgi:nitronate monooxygenase